MSNDRHKFRGKRIDNGEWVYGYYVFRPDGAHLIYWQPFPESSMNTYHEVDPETVGQCTGLKDKNGTLIFEGDLLQFSHGINRRMFPVVWHELHARFYRVSSGVIQDRYIEIDTDNMIIIGNIHENPELLEAHNAATK